MCCLFEESQCRHSCGEELDLSLLTDSSLSFCSMFIHEALWKIQPEFRGSCPSFHLFSFPGGVLLDLPEGLPPLIRGQFIAPPHLSTVFDEKVKQWKEPKVFCLLEKGDTISRLRNHCCLEPLV